MRTYVEPFVDGLVKFVISFTDLLRRDAFLLGLRFYIHHTYTHSQGFWLYDATSDTVRVHKGAQCFYAHACVFMSQSDRNTLVCPPIATHDLSLIRCTVHRNQTPNATAAIKCDLLLHDRREVETETHPLRFRIRQCRYIYNKRRRVSITVGLKACQWYSFHSLGVFLSVIGEIFFWPHWIWKARTKFSSNTKPEICSLYVYPWDFRPSYFQPHNPC